MNQDDDNRRLMLAAALCLLVVGVWGLLKEPQPSTPPTAEAPTETSTTSSTASVPAVDTASVAVSAPTPGSGTQRMAPTVEKHRYAGAIETGSEPVAFEATFSNRGGGLVGYLLPDYFERDADNRPTESPIRLADQRPDAFGQMGGIVFGAGTTFAFPELPVYETVEAEDGRYVYRFQTEEGVVVTREWSVQDGLLEGAVTVQNGSSSPQSHSLGWTLALDAPEGVQSDSSWFSFSFPTDHLEGLCWTDGSVERAALSSLVSETEQYDESVRWVAVDRQYFVAGLVPRDRDEVDCLMEARDDTVRVLARLDPVDLRPGESRRHTFTMYLGVKKPDILTRVDAQLEDAIDYTLLGMSLAPLCVFLLWILGLFQQLTGSWGLAIIGLTVLVKSVTFPLNQKQGKSMRAMTALRPEMELIRTKFAEDRQRQSEELMKLYRKHNVNPAGGCLPMLIQMPIWFALYRSLWVSVDLYQEPFLWLSDLTVGDPYFALPLLLMLVMFLQQRILPTAMDPAQQKMMQYFMPLMFGMFMVALPAGLCLYILVNTLLTIVQQHFINRSIGPPSGGTSPAAQPS